MPAFRKIAALCGLLATALFLNQPGFAEEPILSIQSIGTDHPSSFPKLLRIHLLNPAYTPVNLMEAVVSSKLIVDGKPFGRSDNTPFKGPPGIPAKGNWDGCLSPADYGAALSTGSHKIRLKLAGAQSDDVHVRWYEPLAWRRGTMKTRQEEIEDLADQLTKGLPRSCVELWLTEQDGGMQEGKRVRYFLEPQFKVVVPYAEGALSGNEKEVVGGPVKIYQENRMLD